MTSLRVDEQSAARREAMPDTAVTKPKLTGIVGDKAEEAGDSRSGEDTRRRGWYWNWNTMVTQFAPLIGLDGKGLLDSYIVWTDRREDSPFRGYAFPSTTAEASFYGIDRNVLGTINKILVTLDLIEIKKSMVHRPDDAGNDWKFPHNTYRVKDHGDNFQLTAEAVRRVVQLAIDDTAVYRRIKHIFGSKFKPIDPQSVWYDIIAELEPTANWQKLQHKALEDERRTSERSRKGHAARRKAEDAENTAMTPVSPRSPLQTVPDVTKVATATTVDIDSDNASTVASESSVKSTAAQSSNALESRAAQSSKGTGAKSSSDAAPSSNAPQTIARSTSTTNYDVRTTTTTSDKEAQNSEITANVRQPELLQDFGGGPDDSRDRELTLQLFDDANAKPVTVAAKKLLARIASDFADLAQGTSLSRWALVGAAIEEAVSSGSSYVAAKRVREILNRWRKDGIPEQYAGKSNSRDVSAHTVDTPVTNGLDSSHRFVRTPESESSGPLSSSLRRGESSPIWEAALALLANDEAIPEGVHQRLLEEATFKHIDQHQVQLRISEDLRSAITPEVQAAIQSKVNVAARKPVYLRIDVTETSLIPAATKDHVRDINQPAPVIAQGKVFEVPGSGMTNVQVWAAVQQSLNTAGDIPRAELTMWSTSSELLAATEDGLVLGFASAFMCRRAEHRREDLEREFSHFVGYSCEIEIVEIDTWRSQSGSRTA